MTTRTHYLIDDMDLIPAVNRLHCACGVEIRPDCDMSSVSICDAFEAHLATVNPDELDDWQKSVITNTEDT